MITAKHRITGEIIHAWKVAEKGTEWNEETDKHNFYADPINIVSSEKLDKNKIPVTYVPAKEYKNYLGTNIEVSPYFMIPNKEKKGVHTSIESLYHKRAKNFVYNYIVKIIQEQEDNLWLQRYNIGVKEDGTTKIQIFNIQDLHAFYDIDYANLEVTLNTLNGRTQRADVYIEFKTEHAILGQGIVFEIQISNQTDKKKDERTREYGIKNYSVVWLGKEDVEFEGNQILLKKKTLLIETRTDILEAVNKDYRSEYEQLKNELLTLRKKIVQQTIPPSIKCPVCDEGYMFFKVSFKQKIPFYQCHRCKLGKIWLYDWKKYMGDVLEEIQTKD